MKYAVLFLVLICGLLSTPVQAQVYDIGDVVVEGNQRVEKSAILSILKVKPGSDISIDAIDDDIKAIYRLGRFEDVSALVEMRGNVRTLVYRVEERPLVRKVQFKGNDEFDDDKLRDLITLKVPDIYEPRVIDESIRAMKAEYVKEGFHSVDIQSGVEVDDSAVATVTFTVDEGEKALVDHIRFEGNTVFSDRELRKVMETKERWWLSWLTGRGALVEDILRNDLELIADEYYNTGYLQIKIREPEITLSDDKEDIDILITIEEGDQFSLGQIDLGGDFIRPKEELLGKLTLKPGDVFSRKVLRENVLLLNDIYADEGYAYVNVAPLTKLDPERRLVALTLDIEQGIQVHIGHIGISGNTKTRDKVIRRELDLVEGDLYSASKIKSGRRQINNLGFFESVDLNTGKTAADEVVDLDVAVKERPTGNFTIGAGYSSVDGVVAQGSISQDNLFGRGYKLNFSASVGGKSTTYNIGLVDPYFLDTRLTLGGDLYKTEREYTDFDKSAIGGDLKLGYPLGKDNRIFFIYRYEEKEISNVDPLASSLIKDQEGLSTLSSVALTLSRDTTDYRLDPTRGYMTSLTGEFAGIGGTQHFAKTVLDHRHFFPAFWNTYFSAHGQIGKLFEISDYELPLDEKFFLGGINSLRGFRSRTVGPRIARSSSSIDPVSGEVLATGVDFDYPGGDKEAFFNLEYIFPLIPDANLKGVMFFDAGNAWGVDEDFFSTDLRTSVGGGIRWFSPMGPLRLEWGYNLDPLEDEPQSRFEFTVGRFF